MDPQRLFQLRKANVMPDQASIIASAGGRELVRQRSSGQQQRFPDHASYLRYVRGVNYVRTRNVAPPAPSVTVPGAPTAVSATAGNAQATVTFTAPTSNGGATITSYTVTSNPGGVTATGSASPLTVTGLTNGTAYTFTVVATNSAGPSAPSISSAPVTPTAPPSGLPAPPTSLVGIGGDQAIYVLFTAGSSGSSPITNYEYSIDGGAFIAFAPEQTLSPFMISGGGITNGTPYTVQFKAVNSAGTGIASATVNVTPTTNTLASSGRLIHLDANNTSSYNGTDPTWTNLDSAGSYSAALLNTPTFNTVDKYFTFNGTNQIAQIAAATAINPTVGSSFTLQIWARVNTASTNFGSGDGLISKQFWDPTYDGYSLSTSTNNRLFLNMNGNVVNGNYDSSNNVFDNGWALYTIVVRFGGGSSNPSYAYTSTRRVVARANGESGIGSNDAPLQFPRGIQEPNGNFCPADVGAFYVYNTALSHENIIRNYDATKTRYGL